MFLCSESLLKALFLFSLLPPTMCFMRERRRRILSALTKEFLKLILSFSCAKSVISQEWAKVHANTSKMLNLDAECCVFQQSLQHMHADGESAVPRQQTTAAPWDFL